MGAESLVYRRAHFTARLPEDVLYTRAHYWLRRGEALQIGFTPFATRMLGEVAFVEFTVEPADAVELGETIGNLEGVKALSEIYSPAGGTFVRSNSILVDRPRRINHRPFSEGWLFEIDGEPDPDTLNVRGYMAHLDETIDHLRGVYGDKADLFTQPAGEDPDDSEANS